MNTLTIPTELIVYILSYVDGDSLFQTIQVCRRFGLIVTKIIKEAEHDDMYGHLFKIKTLSLETLRLYFRKIETIDNSKIANLMLAAFTSNQNMFISEMIGNMENIDKKFIFRMSILKDNKFFKTNWFNDNALLNSISQSDINLGSKFINFRKCLKIWFSIIISADQFDTLYQMYPFCPTKKYVALDYLRVFQSNLTNYDTVKITNYIKKMMYSGEILIHYEHNLHTASPTCDKMHRFASYALYGGHLNHFMKHTMHGYRYVINGQIRNCHRLIITCLLRHNHVDSYRQYAEKFQSDPYFQIIRRHIGFANILVNFPVIDSIMLPQLSLATFEFCIKEFGLPAKLPNSNYYVNIVSPTVCQKYLTWGNYVFDNNFISLDTPCDEDYDDLLVDYYLNNTLKSDIVKKMVYQNEEGILEYLQKNDFRCFTTDAIELASTYQYIALCGGHYDLFVKICKATNTYIDRQQKDFYKHNCAGLLRYNHIDQYRAYKRTIPSALASNLKIRVYNIFQNELSISGIDLPQLSLTTFEFLITEFKLRPKIPTPNYHVGLMNIDVYKKYITNETRLTPWVTRAKHSLEAELKSLLHERNLI